MITLTLNNQDYTFNDDPSMPLLWFIRGEVGMTGTKFGCGIAMCGACTVHMDGKPVRSCQTSLAQAAGKKITTIESVHESEVGKVVQDVWFNLDVVQCGFCQSGQIMSATALLTDKKNPTDADIDAAMSGNVCRCATYVRIRQAIHEAANKLDGTDAA